MDFWKEIRPSWNSNDIHVRQAKILLQIILSEYNIMHETCMCISHVYKFQNTYNVLISNFKGNFTVWYMYIWHRAKSLIFIELFWTVNRKLYLKRSCYRLSKTTRSAGKFAQTTELCSFIHLLGFGARSYRSHYIVKIMYFEEH